MLVIGVYTAPVISKAGDTFGVAFSVDGQEKYTERQNKTTSSSVNMECTDKDIDGSYYYASVHAVNAAGTRIDVSHGYEYYFDVNESHNMLNWVPRRCVPRSPGRQWLPNTPVFPNCSLLSPVRTGRQGRTFCVCFSETVYSDRRQDMSGT